MKTFLASLLILIACSVASAQRAFVPVSYGAPMGENVKPLAPLFDSNTSIARYLPQYAAAPNCVRQGQQYWDTALAAARVCSVTGSPGTWASISNAISGASLVLSGTATAAVAKMGQGVGGFAEFSNSATFGGNGYAMLQDSGGATYLNAASGQVITFRVNNASVGSMSATLFTMPAYATSTNCLDSAGAAACGSAAAGSFVIDAAATSVVVSTTSVTANSQVFLTNDSSLGTRLSVTCNTQSSLVLGTPRVTARTAATSFTVTIEVGPTTNPMCLNYYIVN